MYLSLIVALTALAASAVAAPAPASTRVTPNAGGLEYYPVSVNDTTGNGLYIHVRSNNPLIDGHNLQLRKVDKTKNKHIVVVDNSSPVLINQLRRGFIFSQKRDEFNQLHDDGLAASYRNVSATKTDALQEVFFDNFPAQAGPPNTWSFEGPNSFAAYYLYHQVPLETTNGFTICKKNGYYQVHYTLSTANSPKDWPNCEPVGLEAVIAPKLE